MTYFDQRIKERLKRKLSALNSFRPLPETIVRKLKERFEIEMTYNSNAIEGNSLTLKETALVINEGITIKGKSLKDHLEIKNHKEAVDYLYELIGKHKPIIFSEAMIRSFHQMVIGNTDKEWAGRYRNSSVVIAGTDYRPPEAIDVPALMAELMAWIKENKRKLHPIELASLIHYKLTAIHPFFDGNGRTARLIMNIILMNASYPLTVILKNDRKKYYDVLSKADKGNSIPFVRFVTQAVERSLDIYLDILTPKEKKEEILMSLNQLSRWTKFSAKYLNLLARNGKLEAHKEGRIWFSSKKAIERYLDSRERKRK